MLDEPANGLDPEGIHWIREFLRGLAAVGRTVLVSSRLPAEMQILANDVVIVAAGRLVRQGSLNGVVASVTGELRRVKVQTSDPAVLAPALKRRGARVTRDGESLHVSRVPAATVGDVALAAGVALHRLQVDEPDLEDVFLLLTSGRPASDDQPRARTVGEAAGGYGT